MMKRMTIKTDILVLVLVLTLQITASAISFNSNNTTVTGDFSRDLLQGLGDSNNIIMNPPKFIPRLMNEMLDSTYLSEQEILTPLKPKILDSFSLPSWNGLGFAYRKNITIDPANIPNNLFNFPVLIDLESDPDLAGIQQTNGNDLFFTDAQGNKLPFELEYFDKESLNFKAWVKTDISSSTPTIISMYFGNSTVSSQADPTGVWGTDYTGIWHLNNNPAGGTIFDSTSNNYDGTPGGGMTSSDLVKGIIGKAIDFDGTNDLINLGNINSNLWTGITVEAWIFHDTSGDDRVICKSPDGTVANHIFSLAIEPTNKLRVRISTDGTGGTVASSLDSSGTISVGTWHHIAFTWSSASERVYLYIDGVQDVNNFFKDGDSIKDSSVAAIIANVNGGTEDRYFDGLIDEARILKSALSSSWIAVEYLNQFNPYKFYSVGNLEKPTTCSPYRYSKEITIDHSKVMGTTDYNQINVLFDIYDTDLRNTGKLPNNGENLVFTNIDTKNNLYYEIEEWNPTYNLTHARLCVWVQVDTLYVNKDTRIIMNYGNQVDYGYHRPDIIWSNYLGVWHLGESVIDEGSAVNVHKDSSTNNDYGNQHGNDDSIGIIGSAQEFDGINDYIEMGDLNVLELQGDLFYTISGWFYRDSTSSSDVIIDKFYPLSPDYTGYLIYIDGTDGLLHFYQGDDDDDGIHMSSSTNFNTAPSGWYNFYITFDTGINYDSSAWNIYINGVDDTAIRELWGTGAPSYGADDDFYPSNNLASFTIGAHYNSSNYFDGKIDEIRFIQEELSSDRVLTEYNNLKFPTAFYSIGSEQENPNWWIDDSFGRRKDIIIDSSDFGSNEETILQYPYAPGYTETWNHFSKIGGTQEYQTYDEQVADDDSSYIYTTVNNSNRYTSFLIKGTGDLEGDIISLTIKTRTRRTGSIISGETRSFIRLNNNNYYGSSHWPSYSYSTFSDTWITNPLTLSSWTWEDLANLELGVRGRITYTSTIQLRITQVYVEIKYSNNGQLFDYPLLVDIKDSDLKTDVQLDGSDIAFYDSTGTKLSHEISTFNQNFNSTHAHLQAWVKMKTLPLSMSTTLSMYYGNSTIENQEQQYNTWNSFKAVYHLEESPEGNIIDNSLKGINLTSSGSMSSSDLVSGKIGSAINFDGINDQLYTTQNVKFTSFSISAWINFENGNAWRTVLNIDRETSYWIQFAIKDFIPIIDDYIGSYTFGSSLNTYTWYHIMYVYDNNTNELRVYVNGVQAGSIRFLVISERNDDFAIGAWGIYDWFDGRIDELRIGSIPYENAWIKMDYITQVNPGSILNVGAEYDHEAPYVYDFGVDDLGQGNPTFWANVTDSDSTTSTVKIQINETEYSMTKNGTGFWIYQPTVTYGDYIEYAISNASDNRGNYLKKSTLIKSITFNYDTISPTVVDWIYITDTKEFRANVSDSWGIIDTVIVNVTSHENMGDLSELWAVMSKTAYGYVNDTIFLIEGTINFVVTVNDTNGNIFTSATHPGYVTNIPPSVFNIQLSRNPLAVTIPVKSNDTLFVLYNYTDAENDLESGTEIRWEKWNGSNWILQPVFNDRLNVSATSLIRGAIWRVQIHPKDGKDFGDWGISGNITIQNSVPIITSISLTPTAPTTSSNLIASYIWLDADAGDTEQGTQIKWYLDNGNGSGFLLLTPYNNLKTLPSSETSKGFQVYFNVTPSDGLEFGNQIKSTIITIQNSPPTLIVKINDYITPGTVANDTDLIATNITTDIDLDSIDYGTLEIRWWRYNFSSSQFENYANNTFIISNTTTLVSDLWRVEMRVSDGTDMSSWYSSATISIGVPPNTPPQALNVNLTSSIPVAGGYLYANYTYYDLNGDPEATTTFKWYRNGIHQPQFDGMQQVSTFLIKNDNWTVYIRPQDIYNDYGDWSSSEIIKILNSPPIVVTATIFPSSNVYTSNILLANFLGDDIDEDSITLISIVWLNGSTEISELNNQTEVAAAYTKKGEVWKYIIRVYDGEAWSTNFTSTSIIILNSLPYLESVILTGGSNTSQDVTLNYSFKDIDNDIIDIAKTKINWTIEFESGGSTIVNEVWTLSNIYFSAGDYITVQITPHDGEALGMVWESYRVRLIIGNAVPQIQGQPNILAPNNSTIYYASGKLSLNYSAYDADFGESSSLYYLDFDIEGYVIGTQYLWYRNGILMSDLNTPTVPATYLARGQIWKASVRIRDRFGSYSNWVNSSSILIINSLPYITSFQILNPSVRSDQNLDIKFTFYDYDLDEINISKTLIYWYKNSLLISGTENSTVISVEKGTSLYYVTIRLYSDYYIRGDNITVEVQPHDGLNWAIAVNTSSTIMIRNAKPSAYNVNLLANGTSSIAYTNDPLNISWAYFDPDNDLEVSTETKIIWRNKGIIQPMYENFTSLNPIYTLKGDIWSVEVFVYDGFEWSSIGKNSLPIIIINTPPVIISVIIESNFNNRTETYSDTDLILDLLDNVNFTDVDGDYILWYESDIKWFRNSVHISLYDNLTILPSSATTKGEIWYAVLKITDDLKIWSLNVSSQNILIVNKAPEVLNVLLDGNEYSSFFVEDENITIIINLFDVDSGDNDSSYLFWSVNGSYLSQFDNLHTIPSMYTNPGDIWSVEVIASDGFRNSTVVFPFSFHIESRPKVLNITVEVLQASDGQYLISSLITDALNHSIELVRYDLMINGIILSDSGFMAPNSTEYWRFSYDLLRNENNSYFGSIATVYITARSNIGVTTVQSYNFTLIDGVAPRISRGSLGVYFKPDKDSNPTNLTFYAEIEEYGLGVEQILLYYYFELIEEGEGAFLAQENYKVVEMKYQQTIGLVQIYTISVPFAANESNYNVLYYITTLDKSGNFNENAFDIRNYPERLDNERLIYSVPGLPEWVLLIAGIAVFLVIIGSIIYVRFIRKPELVGLDKELVITKSKEIADSDAINALDTHTIGIVTSFFDQRHGPIPIIVIPEILNDNFAKLVEMSDRSFSVTGFSDDFEIEVPSGYDFVLAQGTRISVLTYGFSLERPEARGGKENITINFLVHKDLFPLVNQFVPEIQKEVHQTHIMMDKEPKEKEKIRKSVFDLRKFLSKVILAYQEIYGTTELLLDEDN